VKLFVSEFLNLCMRAFSSSLAVFLLGLASLSAQPFSHKKQFNHQDSLRGSIGPGRDWWDVSKYDIHAAFNPSDSSVKGMTEILFNVTGTGNIMQIDLQDPLQMDSSLLNTTRVQFKKEGNAWFAELNAPVNAGTFQSLKIWYHGKPKVAKHAPWDGGLIWRKDSQGNPWISIACQGLGASVWYPCKDHQSDEPDSAALHITCPENLTAIGNGRLRGKKANADKTVTFTWAVTDPINNYCIIPYIGKYTSFSEKYNGEKGNLDMEYWVLEENLEKAKKQFTDAPRMMKALEHWFGPYPFYKDSYKLVDAPHLGMEHQSAIAYGNGYRNGYYGIDLSGSGWGLKWDFIIVHESGHEWFANNITTKDIADMWVHEGFTNYSETLFTDYYYGKNAGNEYCQGLRSKIDNDIPIIGPYGVNQEGSGDMYYKAANMIHMIRQIINDDEKFRMMLREMNRKYYHSTVTSAEIEKFISEYAGIDFSKVFDQYLRTTLIPVLNYKIEKGMLSYNWTECVEGFNMPVKIVSGNESRFIKPTTQIQTIEFSGKNMKVDENFYVKTEKVN
jgi:aminopeptidase N